jgi:hypothetical protein
MKNFTRLVLACAAALTVSLPSYASVIVDTGPGKVAYGGGFALQPDQWLANSFTLADSETITGINGWITGNAGTLKIGLYSAQNGLPGTSLFSADAKADQYFSGAWVGVSGLAWTLNAGTYFVAFEVPANYTFRGAMDDTLPAPTGKEAFTDELGNWHSGYTAHIGFQVFGDAAGAAASTSVPEPSTPALAGLALVALAIASRKRA